MYPFKPSVARQTPILTDHLHLTCGETATPVNAQPIFYNATDTPPVVVPLYKRGDPTVVAKIGQSTFRRSN